LEAAARAHLAARDAAALADYQRLLSLNPKSAMYEDETGFLLVATNRVAAGISHLKKATELDAKLTVAWYHLGVAQCLAREIDVCVANLQRAVKLAPDDGDYLFRLGSAYNDAGRFSDAIPELTKASELQPKNWQIWGRLPSHTTSRNALSKDAMLAGKLLP
jgi:tetratricopeptide (TPR) repeat protein